MYFSAITLLVALQSVYANICGTSFSQCGGEFFKESTCCSTVSNCTYVTEYYSQCMPMQYNTTDLVARRYGQCGGANYTGPVDCTPDCACISLDPYYDQCLPLPERDPAVINSTVISERPSCTCHQATAIPTSAPATAAPVTAGPSPSPRILTNAPTESVMPTYAPTFSPTFSPTANETSNGTRRAQSSRRDGVVL